MGKGFYEEIDGVGAFKFEKKAEKPSPKPLQPKPKPPHKWINDWFILFVFLVSMLQTYSSMITWDLGYFAAVVLTKTAVWTAANLLFNTVRFFWKKWRK